MKELQYLNKYFAKYKFQFLLGTLITIIAQIFSQFTPVFVGDAVTAIEMYTKGQWGAEKVQTELIHAILIILGSTMLAGVLTFFMRQTLIVMSRHIEFDLKNEIFRHYERLPQSFYKQHRTGDLMNRISEDVNKVRQYVGPAIMYSLNTVIGFIVILTQMIMISPSLTLYTILPLPLLAYSIFWVSREINKRSADTTKPVATRHIFSGNFFRYPYH
jgi:ATP-binding cassette subfamily B protein